MGKEHVGEEDEYGTVDNSSGGGLAYFYGASLNSVAEVGGDTGNDTGNTKGVSGSSGGGCNSGLAIIALAALITLRKSRN